MFERFAAAIESLPGHLHSRPLNDPEVQRTITAALNAPVGVSGEVSPRFDPARCATGITTFIAETTIPVGKAWRIVKEFGGIRKFADIVYRFIKSGTIPGEASEEAANLLVALTGIPGVIAACS
ncbi:hypothetical protein CFN78_16920 [Amycolatopsis antarctica]|uniref:Uncharacterized protein n=2 Tax=Amycolatopsis antarctica TaxID=1854586 RepID=A0A263D151_9PSEU|nr:hypothetical protein CFN78_16920 [Amycolatopsis antarctica]